MLRAPMQQDWKFHRRAPSEVARATLTRGWITPSGARRLLRLRDIPEVSPAPYPTPDGCLLVYTGDSNGGEWHLAKGKGDDKVSDSRIVSLTLVQRIFDAAGVEYLTWNYRGGYYIAAWAEPEMIDMLRAETAAHSMDHEVWDIVTEDVRRILGVPEGL